MTVGEIRKKYQESLGKLYPQSEANAITRFMLEEVLALSALYQTLNTHVVLTSEQEKVLESHLSRLLKNEPFQHILGYELFHGLKLEVNPDVLIPRPETEELVEWILNSAPSAQTILDIGTGSGCIALSLAQALPEVRVDALEVSDKALVVAQRNAEKNGIKVDFFRWIF